MKTASTTSLVPRFGTGESNTGPRKFVLAALAVFALTAGAVSTWADTQYYPSFTISLDACGNRGLGGCTPDGDDPGLNNLVMLYENPSLFMSTATYNGVIPSFVSGEISNFAIPTIPDSTPPSDYLPTGAMLMGWLDYLPTDGQNPADHVLLFVNTSIASSLVGHSWDSLFNADPGDPGNYSEDQIIFDMQNLGDVTNVIQLIQFMNFNPDLLADPNGGTFDAIAFSNGTNVGSATAALGVVNTGGGTTPEPSTLLTLAAGLGGLGFLKRRRDAA